MSFESSFIASKSFEDKAVVLRVDYNVPIEKGVLLDDERLLRSIPTIEYILEQTDNLKILTHLGRPSEQDSITEEFSLAPVAKRLEELLQKEVKLVDSIDELKSSNSLAMLENVRAFIGEKNNDDELSKKLGDLGDIFVMDAFGTAHRKQASTYGIVNFVEEACFGLLIEQEMKALEKIVLSPDKPLLGIIGGSKISTKINVIESLTNHCDWLIVGGALANTCYAAQGKNIGKSLFEPSYLDVAKKIIEHPQIVIPTFVVVSNGSNVSEKSINDLSSEDVIFDVGQQSVEAFSQYIEDANTIVWNGPLGKFEDDRFSKGTEGIAKKIAEANAMSIIGGGETLAAFSKIQMMDSVDYASTGGGAFLEYIELGTLPSLELINKKNLGG